MKLGPMGYLFMKREKRFKTRIYIIIPIFPPHCIVSFVVHLARMSMRTYLFSDQKWPLIFISEEKYRMTPDVVVVRLAKPVESFSSLIRNVLYLIANSFLTVQIDCCSV